MEIADAQVPQDAIESLQLTRKMSIDGPVGEPLARMMPDLFWRVFLTFAREILQANHTSDGPLWGLASLLGGSWGLRK